ncbi:MAG: hypothetical protein MUC63_05175 [Planctomycetes bacterium]|jgi:hypothetical protein|nr:hypothetical protein [Planctomycetota bacterium]
MKIEKTPQGRFRIVHGPHAVEFDRERYEDLFYAVPVDSTAFYRLLTEAVCETEAERKTMVALIQALPAMEAGLNALQDQIAKLKP